MQAPYALDGDRAVGPQKGAGPHDLEALQRSLRHWSTVVSDATRRDDAARAGAGAAGGTGYAALALLDAEIRPGIELILDLIDFDRRVVGADLVVTGEGSLDAQSLAGKAPIGVARAAASASVRVVAVAGRLQLSAAQLRDAGIAAAYPLTDLEPDLNRCIANAGPLLRRVGAQIANGLAQLDSESGQQPHVLCASSCCSRPLFRRRRC